MDLSKRGLMMEERIVELENQLAIQKAHLKALLCGLNLSIVTKEHPTGVKDCSRTTYHAVITDDLF